MGDASYAALLQQSDGKSAGMRNQPAYNETQAAQVYGLADNSDLVSAMQRHEMQISQRGCCGVDRFLSR